MWRKNVCVCLIFITINITRFHTVAYWQERSICFKNGQKPTGWESFQNFSFCSVNLFISLAAMGLIVKTPWGLDEMFIYLCKSCISDFCICVSIRFCWAVILQSVQSKFSAGPTWGPVYPTAATDPHIHLQPHHYTFIIASLLFWAGK